MKYIARYGAMRLHGVFSPPNEEDRFFHGARVIVRTSRGQEIATILCEANDETLSALPEELEESRITRAMTVNDESEAKRIHGMESDEFRRCQQIVQRMKIEMNLVRIEHVFGGERIIIYYVAEGRIDFRELVRILAGEFQTRIEMKQIGVRDETKLLADIGDCGREVCCNTYLNAMPPVSMKMAKLQKATLDQTKISGRCGRLKCCLRYEFDIYNHLQSITPSVGRMVETPEGRGRVVLQELLAKKVVVEFPDHSRKSFWVNEVSLTSSLNDSEEPFS